MNINRYLKFILWLGICMSGMHPGFTQFDKNYQPIRLDGKIPEAVFQSAADKTKADMLRHEEENLDESESMEFYESVNFALSRMLLSGNVYFNDEMTAYVTRIVDHLLRKDPELRKELKIYVTRFASPNAYSWRDGSIFVNIGLLSQLKSEAQVAFVLSHEIAHYTRKHTLLDFQKRKESSRKGISRGNELETMLARLQYSREQEYEADSLGFLLYQESDYEVKEGMQALAMLKSYDEQDSVARFNFLDLLAKGDTSVTLSATCVEIGTPDTTTVRLVTVPRRVIEVNAGEKTDEKQESDKKKEEEAEEVLEEIFSTHPDIDKRIKALERIHEREKKTGSKAFIEEQTAFERVSLVSEFESIGKYMQDASYGRSLFVSLQLLERYPQNVYLKEIAAHSLYWIHFYYKSDSEENILPNYDEIKDPDYSRLICFLNKTEGTVLYELTRKFIEKAIQDHPESEELAIVQARLCELQKSVKEAKAFYKNYMDKFAAGKHYKFAAHKFNSNEN